jgi:hypothetical protein
MEHKKILASLRPKHKKCLLYFFQENKIILWKNLERFFEKNPDKSMGIAKCSHINKKIK